MSAGAVAQRLVVQVGSDLTQLTTGLRTAQSRMLATSAAMSAAGRKMTYAVTLPVVGVGILAAKAAMEAEKSQARLGEAFKKAGLDAGDYAKSIEQVDKNTRQLGFDDEEAKDSLGSLIIATGSYSKSLKLLSTAQDVSRFTGRDLGSSTKMLTMAMAGSQRAIKQLGLSISPVTSAQDALKRSNVDVTTEAGKQAMAQAKLTDKQSTAAAVVDLLNQKLGGQAEAYAKTSEGGMARFRANLDELLEKIGTNLLPILDRAVAGLSQLLAWFDGLSPSTQRWVMVVAGIAAAAGPVLMIIGGLVGAFATLMPVIVALVSPIGLLVAAIVAIGAAITLAVVAPEKLMAILQRLGMSTGQAKATVEALQNAFKGIKAVTEAVFPIIAAIVQRSLNLIANVFRVVGALLRGDWSAAWNALKKLVSDWVRDTIAIVTTIGSKIVSVFSSLGSKISGPFVAAWDGVKRAMDATLVWVKEKALKVGLALIEPMTHIPGRLGNKFREAKDAMLKELDPMKFQASKLAGDTRDAIKKALFDGGDENKQKMREQMGKVRDGMQSSNPELRAKAREIAASIRDAFPGGFDGLSALIGAKVASEIRAGLDQGYQNVGSTGAQYAEEALGKPIGEGVIRGFLLGTVELPSKISEKLRKSLDAAKLVVDAHKGKLTTAWQRLSQDWLAAFDANTEKAIAKIQAKLAKSIAAIDKQLAAAEGKLNARGGKETASERALREMDEGIAAEDRARAMAEAKKALSDAESGVGFEAEEGETPEQAAARETRRQEAIVAARKAVLDAERAEARLALEKAAEEERKERDADTERKIKQAQNAAERKRKQAQKDAGDDEKEERARRAYMRRQVEDYLEAMEKALERQPAKWRKILGDTAEMLKKNGVTMKSSGKTVGLMFAEGLRDSMGQVKEFAKGLAELIEQYLKTNSPAKKGPLSKLDHWADGFADAYIGGMDLGKVQRHISGLVAPVGGSSFGFGGSGGGGATHHSTHVQLVVDRRTLAEQVVEEMYVMGRSGRPMPWEVT